MRAKKYASDSKSGIVMPKTKKPSTGVKVEPVEYDQLDCEEVVDAGHHEVDHVFSDGENMSANDVKEILAQPKKPYKRKRTNGKNSKKRNSNKPKRPLNAWLLHCKKFREENPDVVASNSVTQIVRLARETYNPTPKGIQCPHCQKTILPPFKKPE